MALFSGYNLYGIPHTSADVLDLKFRVVLSDNGFKGESFTDQFQNT
jgi:hypothetical protein